MSGQQPFDLTGRVAIVTGGNRGLGKGMALGLAQAGAKIVAAARDEAANAQAVAELRAAGAEAVAQTTDVTSEDSVQAMVEAAIQAFGSVDILVNNAGTSVRKDPQALTAGEWDRVLAVNLKGAFLCSRQVYPHMKQAGGGKIINIGSMMAVFGSDWVTPYAASKGGVVQLGKSLALAWAKDNIQVNAILPGWFETDFTTSIATLDPERHRNISGRIPAGRWGQPGDLAGAAVFLASRASDYVTGAIAAVHGDYSAM